MNADQQEDTVERAYEEDELPDWELVFELSRRMMAAETSDSRQRPVGASRQT